MPQNAGGSAVPALQLFSLLPNWQQQGAKLFASGNSTLSARGWLAVSAVDTSLNGLILSLASLSFAEVQRTLVALVVHTGRRSVSAGNK